MDAMDKKIFDLFDFGDDLFVPEEENLFDPARIHALALNRINHPREEFSAERRKVKPLLRTLLVAAIIALLLVGSAFAVWQLSIRDSQISEPYGTEGLIGEAALYPWERVDLAANGLADSPETKAYLEWTEWNEAWWEENPDPWSELGVDDTWYETPQNYVWYYNASFKEQAEKLEEITQKYGLKIHETKTMCFTEDELCSVLGLEEIWCEEITVSDIYVYEDGAFVMDGYMDESDQKHFVMNLSVDGTLSISRGSLPSEYEEWNYVTTDGTPVVLALADFDYSSPMLTFIKNARLVVRFEEATLSLEIAGVIAREELESYAEWINYAELGRIFSSDTDRSYISAAVETQQADALIKMEEGRAEAEALDAALQAEVDAYIAQHTEEEWDTILRETLGDYELPETLEGYHLSERSDTHIPFSHSVMYTYTNETGDKMDAYGFSYGRYWSEEDAGESVTRETFDSNFNGPMAEGKYKQVVIGGYTVYVTDIPGCGHNVCWYDEERDLEFSIFDGHILGDPDAFTEEEMLGLAESFIESLEEKGVTEA